MSKLFDQLKGAAREREGGLLLDALARKQQAGAAEASAGASPPVQAELALPERAGERLAQQASPNGPAPESSPSPPGPGMSRASLAGLGLAAAIFIVAVLAWHAAPWRAPQKLRIDPETLKLDRKLDLDRAPSKGTTPSSRPS